jgi:hypothetical protein
MEQRLQAASAFCPGCLPGMMLMAVADHPMPLSVKRDDICRRRYFP